MDRNANVHALFRHVGRLDEEPFSTLRTTPRSRACGGCGSCLALFCSVVCWLSYGIDSPAWYRRERGPYGGGASLLFSHIFVLLRSAPYPNRLPAHVKSIRTPRCYVVCAA